MFVIHIVGPFIMRISRRDWSNVHLLNDTPYPMWWFFSLSGIQLLPSTRCLPAWIHRGSCRDGKQAVATPAVNRGRASPVLDPQSLQCELHIILVIASIFCLLLCVFFLDYSLCNGYLISKLPGLGLSGNLAYNMNAMDSLVELWVSFMPLSCNPVVFLGVLLVAD